VKERPMKDEKTHKIIQIDSFPPNYLFFFSVFFFSFLKEIQLAKLFKEGKFIKKKIHLAEENTSRCSKPNLILKFFLEILSGNFEIL
jgi:hypothetical protein